MSHSDKVPLEQKLIEVVVDGTKERIPAISTKWIEEENRTISVYPGLPAENGTVMFGEEETWLELARFVQDDLRWLLSLSHHKFWSHMIYSKQVHHLLVLFLKKYPPHCLKENLLVSENVRDVFQEIEHLVFLVFLRLSTEKESDSCYIKNLGDILYNNYLFTVPILLDICTIYGVSNGELVKKMVNNVISLAPSFLDDLQEIVPHFFQVLCLIRDKFSVEQFPKLQNVHSTDVLEDLILYLHDSLATIQIFLSLCSKGCKVFCKSEFILEIISFYSNVLPKIQSVLSKNNCHFSKIKSSLFTDLFESIRVDLLNIVKSIFDFLLSEANRIPNKRDESVDEYLIIMMELLSEPAFLSDYNDLYPIKLEIEKVTQGCLNVDTMKVDHIIEGVALAVNQELNKNAAKSKHNSASMESEITEVKMSSLITQVKDIFPHLEADFLKECLKYYEYNTERVIAEILEGSLPGYLKDLQCNPGRRPKVNREPAPVENPQVEGKHNSKYKTLKEMLDDRSEINEIKERYAQLALLTDETYDDEYDDTYDENMDVREADETEKERRPFVVPRVLREREEVEEEIEEEVDIESEEESRDSFVQNPAELRERREMRKAARGRRDPGGRDEGKNESKQAILNRQHFKEAHKSHIANHNRRRQADRKRRQGMIPS